MSCIQSSCTDASTFGSGHSVCTHSHRHSIQSDTLDNRFCCLRDYLMGSLQVHQGTSNQLLLKILMWPWNCIVGNTAYSTQRHVRKLGFLKNIIKRVVCQWHVPLSQIPDGISEVIHFITLGRPLSQSLSLCKECGKINLVESRDEGGVTDVGIKREGFFVSMALTGLACVMTVWEERQTDSSATTAFLVGTNKLDSSARHPVSRVDITHESDLWPFTGADESTSNSYLNMSRSLLLALLPQPHIAGQCGTAGSNQ
ncbi:hypothetical protein Q9233_009911 [Columba guinea]|nr:hypothetical protein Q9233_009911 [Columba guinea]